MLYLLKMTALRTVSINIENFKTSGMADYAMTTVINNLRLQKKYPPSVGRPNPLLFWAVAVLPSDFILKRVCKGRSCCT